MVAADDRTSVMVSLLLEEFVFLFQLTDEFSMLSMVFQLSLTMNWVVRLTMTSSTL